MTSSRGYRAATLLCSGCRSDMSELRVDESTIDVCNACGAVWLDWFDGEPGHLARRAPPLPPPGHGAATSPVSTPVCPRCASALALDDLAGCAAPVLRCPDCFGVHIAREAFVGLVDIAEPLPESTRERPWLAALLSRLRSVVAALRGS